MSARMLLAIGCCCFVPLAPAAEDRADDVAKAAVEQFLKAFKAKDIAALMAAVEVPWFHQSERIIKDRGELEKAFQQLFANSKDLSRLVFTVKLVAPYGDLRGKTNETEQKLLDEVVRPDDRVVLVELDQPARKKETVVLVIRIRDGKGRVVGLKN